MMTRDETDRGARPGALEGVPHPARGLHRRLVPQGRQDRSGGREVKGRNGLAKLLAQLDPRDKKRKGHPVRAHHQVVPGERQAFPTPDPGVAVGRLAGQLGGRRRYRPGGEDRDGNLGRSSPRRTADKYWITKHRRGHLPLRVRRPRIHLPAADRDDRPDRRRSEKTLNEQAVPSASSASPKPEAAQVNWPNCCRICCHRRCRPRSRATIRSRPSTRW